MTDRRALLTGGIAASAFATLPAAARSAAGVTVSPTGPVRTVGEALALAAAAGGRPFTIRLDPGTYVEKLTVTVPNLRIVGTRPGAVISFGAASGHDRPDGTGRWGTSGSATLTIDAPDVTLSGITVRNSFDYIANRRPGGIEAGQAVALAIQRGADRTRVERCRMEGYQDTLLVNSRALFDDCHISGNVDFIFGGGAALFRRARIVTRHVPGAESGGYVAAPSTPETQPYGLVFRDCRLEREAGVPDASTWLGRPWRAGGNMSLLGQSAFIDCWMDAHIRREGWTWMGYRGPDGSRRQLTPQEARLVEHGSRGPGAGPASDTRRVLSDAIARTYAPRTVLGGWTG